MQIIDLGDPQGLSGWREFADRTNSSRLTPEQLETISPDTLGSDTEPAAAIAKILRDVRVGGDEAVAELQSRLAGVPSAPDRIVIATESIEHAHANASESFLETLRATIEPVTRIHQNSLPIPTATYRFRGSTIATATRPMRTVGILLPARTRAAISTLVATVIPAKVAGVEHIAVAVPPDETGEAPNEVLAALHELKIEHAYRLDPLAALAAFAYGTPSVPRADLVAGRGDALVTEARRHVSERLLVDRLHGSADFAVFADASAPVAWIAADWLAAAELAPLGAVVLVTDSRELAEAIAPEVRAQASRLDGGDAALAELEAHARIAIVEDGDDGAARLDELAPQTLSILREDAEDVADKIGNAGAIFIGRYSPPSISGVCATAGALQPGGGAARFASGLSVEDFRKRTLHVNFTEAGYKSLAGTARALAGVEDMPGHERSITLREG